MKQCFSHSVIILRLVYITTMTTSLWHLKFRSISMRLMTAIHVVCVDNTPRLSRLLFLWDYFFFFKISATKTPTVNLGKTYFVPTFGIRVVEDIPNGRLDLVEGRDKEPEHGERGEAEHTQWRPPDVLVVVLFHYILDFPALKLPRPTDIRLRSN